MVGEYGHDLTDAPDRTAANGSTFSLQTGLSDGGLDFEMWYPEWDNTLGNSGLICMTSHDHDSLGQAVVTPPRIHLASETGADVVLMKVDHPHAGWSSADPLTSFAWIHEPRLQAPPGPGRPIDRAGF